MSHYVDFCLSLPELPMVDIEGRAEVTVTPGLRAIRSPWPGDPGHGPEVTVEAVEVMARRPALVRSPAGEVIDRTRYAHLPDTPLGRALDAAIRDKLINDADWIDSAAAQARDAA